MLGSSLDLKEIEALYQIYLDQKSDEINRYMQRELNKYIGQLYLEIMMGWDGYYSSYTPTVYVRTRETEKGINPSKSVRQGNKFVATLDFDDNNMYHSDGHGKTHGTDKTTGHAYAMIDIGWEDKSARRAKYLFTYYDGSNITARAIKKMRQIMPDWIDIEIEASGGLKGHQRQAYKSYENKYGKG